MRTPRSAAYSAAVPSLRAAVASACSGLWSSALPGSPPRENSDERGAEVAGQVEECAEFGEDGFVVAGGRDARISGEAEDLDARRLELGGHIGPFGRAEAQVDGFFGVRAQLDAVIAVRGRQTQDVGEGETGNAEGGERQLHVTDPTRHSSAPSSRADPAASPG